MTRLKIACLLCVVYALAWSDDDDKPVAVKADGKAAVVLTAKQPLGVETVRLKPAHIAVEITAYGKVLPIQPLLALRQRYLTALTERDVAQTRLKQAQLSINRQQTLYREGITAKRDLEARQAELQIDEAQLAASNYHDKTIKEEALLNWGKVLTDWALSSNSAKLDAFLSGEKKLLQITLPSGQALAQKVKTVYVATSGQRDKAHGAEFISIAPQTDVSTQSNSYFFQSKASDINVGMNISAWLPEQHTELAGVLIPKSALLWSMELAFVYVKSNDGHFSRRAIVHHTVTKNGYFVSEGLQAGEEIVVTGGQMLLSEEMRGQIPDEN